MVCSVVYLQKNGGGAFGQFHQQSDSTTSTNNITVWHYISVTQPTSTQLNTPACLRPSKRCINGAKYCLKQGKNIDVKCAARQLLHWYSEVHCIVETTSSVTYPSKRGVKQWFLKGSTKFWIKYISGQPGRLHTLINDNYIIYTCTMYGIDIEVRCRDLMNLDLGSGYPHQPTSGDNY